MDIDNRIRKARRIPELFELVKEIVKEYLGMEQAGLLMGVSDLGAFSQGFVGAFYSLPANMIIINKKPLQRLLETNPKIYNYYLFHIILHEYIHAVGSYDEEQTRALVFEICSHYLGQSHTATLMAKDMSGFVPQLTYPAPGYQPPKDLNIDFVMGLDRKNMDYIM